LNGLVEGLIAFGTVKIIFLLLNTPFNNIALVIVGLEFGLLYADGIFRRTIKSEVPIVIGTVIGLFVIPLLAALSS